MTASVCHYSSVPSTLQSPKAQAPKDGLQKGYSMLCSALHQASLVGVLSDTALILGPVEIYSKATSDLKLYPPNTLVICHMVGECQAILITNWESRTHKESIPK